MKDIIIRQEKTILMTSYGKNIFWVKTQPFGEKLKGFKTLDEANKYFNKLLQELK